MNTSNPKYITYRGAKYQRVSTLSEVVVEPRNRCCVLTIVETDNLTKIHKEYESGNSEKIADSAFKKWIEGVDNSDFIDDFPEKPIKVDDYSYYTNYVKIEARVFTLQYFIICTKGRGKYSHLYDLAVSNDDEGVKNAIEVIIKDMEYSQLL